MLAVASNFLRFARPSTAVLLLRFSRLALHVQLTSRSVPVLQECQAISSLGEVPSCVNELLYLDFCISFIVFVFRH
jgi:hypothetical protein